MTTRALPILLFFLAGCYKASFVQTDPAYVPKERDGYPQVYLDRLPAQPYRSVGIIELRGDAAALSLKNQVHVVQKKGRELGCELIVERSIHRVSQVPARPRWVASLGDLGRQFALVAPAQTPFYWPSAVIESREYVCGIWEL